MSEITPQQKLLNKIYKGQAAQRTPTLQQQQIQRSFNKPSGIGSSQGNVGTVSRGVIAQSKARVLRQQVKGQLASLGNQLKTSAASSRASAAVNVSKFNAGIRGKLAPTLAVVKGIAIKQGVKATSLKSTLANSKFLAGTPKAPAILLTIGNYAVWKENFKAIRGIMDSRSPQPTLLFTPQKPTVINEGTYPFLGGQESGVSYRLEIDYEFRSKFTSEGSATEARTYQAASYPGSITSVEVSITGTRNTLSWNITFADGNNQSQGSQKPAGTSSVITTAYPRLVRIDGQPDTGGNPPATQEPQVSNSGVNQNQVKVFPSNQAPRTPIKSTPSNNNKIIEKSKVKNDDKITPLPRIIPIPVILPGDNTTIQPTQPTDKPIVKLKDTTTPVINKKPKSIAKRTYYPSSLPFQLPGTQVIKNNQTGVDTVITRRYAAKNIPDGAEEVTSKIPTTTFPAIPRPIIQNKNKREPSLPTQTKVNPCKKGCGGATSGLAQADSDNLNKATAALQGIDLALLKKIDATTTATKGAVFSDKFGLQKIQSFAETAWRSTRVGKILNYLSVAGVLHNATILSINVGASLGDTISAIANNTISIIKNEESNPIDINATLGTSLENFIKGLIGAENYQEGSKTFAKYSRAVNAASNIVYSITAMNAGLAQGLETIGSYTGKIGNSLKKSGAVLENSYSWMSEKVAVKTGRLGQLQSGIDKLEGVGDALSDLENVSSNFREIQEEKNNITEQTNLVKEALEKEEEDKKKGEDLNKIRSQAAQPELTDLVRDPVGE